MQISIELNETEIETLQYMYAECIDKIVSYPKISQDDENRINDLEDQLNVIEHLCHAIEGINK